MPGMKRVKIKWQTWRHTWAGFLGGVCGHSVDRYESGQWDRTCTHPAACMQWGAAACNWRRPACT